LGDGRSKTSFTLSFWVVVQNVDFPFQVKWLLNTCICSRFSAKSLLRKRSGHNVKSRCCKYWGIRFATGMPNGIGQLLLGIAQTRTKSSRMDRHGLPSAGSSEERIATVTTWVKKYGLRRLILLAWGVFEFTQKLAWKGITTWAFVWLSFWLLFTANLSVNWKTYLILKTSTTSPKTSSVMLNHHVITQHHYI